MFGFFAHSLFTSVMGWIAVIGFVFMLATAIYARQKDVEYTEKTKRNRKIAWVVTGVLAVVFLNGGMMML